MKTLLAFTLSLLLLFLGSLRQNALALQWLESNNVEIATADVAEWSHE